MRPNIQKGFTLVELIMAILIIGIISMIMSPTIRSISSIRSLQSDAEYTAINYKIGQGLLDWSRSQTGASVGALPAPYTDAGIGVKSAPANPAEVAVLGSAANSIVSQGGLVSFQLIRTESDVNRARVRVYERSGAIPVSYPLFKSYGPLVDLNYNVGAIYIADCVPTAPCNTNNVVTVPDSTGNIINVTIRNITMPQTADQSALAYSVTSSTGIPDKGIVYISTLSINKDLIQDTANNILRIRDAIRANADATLLGRASTDVSRPFVTGTFTPTNVTGTAANNFCRSGWANLADSTNGIMARLGMGVELASTRWGGRIEYCMDFDPNNAKAAATAPWFAALRFRKNLSLGAAPLTTDTNNCPVDLRNAAVVGPCNVVIPI